MDFYKDMLIEAKKELKRIEHDKRTWKSKFIREQEIWDEIAIQVCSNYEGWEKAYWDLVAELYHKKYSQ
jgi:hypothetical protein